MSDTYKTAKIPIPPYYRGAVLTAKYETEESHTAHVKVLALPVSRVNNEQHIWLRKTQLEMCMQAHYFYVISSSLLQNHCH